MTGAEIVRVANDYKASAADLQAAALAYAALGATGDDTIADVFHKLTVYGIRASGGALRKLRLLAEERERLKWAQSIII